MAKKKIQPQYVLDPETLTFELQEPPKKDWWSLPLVAVSGLVLFVLYMWLNASADGMSLPKTAILRFQNSEWKTRVDQMSQQLDQYEDLLSQLETRDERIYRSVYGMDEIPQSVRQAGFGGENRYADLKGTSLLGIVRRMDILEKRLFIQSVSFDEVAHLQQNAGDMAAHIPAIPPLNTDPSTYRLSSTFGYRSDPFTGGGNATRAWISPVSPATPFMRPATEWYPRWRPTVTRVMDCMWRLTTASVTRPAMPTCHASTFPWETRCIAATASAPRATRAGLRDPICIMRSITGRIM